MNKRNTYTKYVTIIALIAILTFIWGCKADIEAPPVAVTGITVTGAGDAITVGNGSTLQMSAAVLPADATDMSVTWSVVAGTGTATISETGLLSATGAGTVRVNATANDDSAAVGELEVTVTAVMPTTIDVTTITVTGASDAITVVNASTLQLSASVLPADATDKSITWSVVAGMGTATISEAGLLTGTAVGTVTAKATANDGSGIVGELAITVTAVVPTPIDVTTITVTGAGDAITVANGSTLQMNAAVLPIDATDKSFVWSVVAGTGTATISETGLLTATGMGTVTVNATANDGSDSVGTLGITITEKVISAKAITGLTAPVTGESPVTAITNTIEYTSSSVTWTKADLTVLAPEGTYEVDTVYIATITLVPVTGYTLTGVTENFFTVEGATATNAIDIGVVTAVFPVTVTAPIVPLARVDMGTADDFVILAKSGITTTGVTAITGDLGISPAARATVTGFAEILSLDGTYATSGLVLGGGKIYASDFIAPTPDMLIAAILDMETAYDTIVALTDPRPELIAGGTTLYPGLYKSIPAVSLSINLTLDAEGDEAAVWIFQITGALNVAAEVEIVLLNGAKAENIFWQVTGAVSLLANSKMQGIVLGEGVIALTDGATIEGKLLGQTNVTLIGNTVVDPLFVPML
ncbi:ice-binding family protein [Sphaerochaeta globosa]|uniref:Ig domain protein group 2 domain protein n=1 Tax=Sphaerochaeta globosa (strain ATCC BAA-1886 / DSM 22777 / Buddy) TaxID=158189 RepID=F0RUU1_SPHGB|nr:ice-binding family protein [Sphaerochaeta globosa]ADY12519.1 Ig domain protein group 2 domain protein [Sphaerochaeta globosa str. Buddy]